MSEKTITISVEAYESLKNEVDTAHQRIADAETEAQMHEAEAKRLAVLLQENGIEDSGAEALALPQHRMEQLKLAVGTLTAQKRLVAWNGLERPRRCDDIEDSAVLHFSAYENARRSLARYEKKYGNLGGPSFADEA